MAQNRIVKGVVFDTDGSPLTGVTVSDENSTTSTQTLDGGQFEISVSPYTKYVVATAEGYFTARAEIDGSFLILRLKVDKKYLENKLKAEENARIAAEKEAQAKAQAEEEARLAAEKEAKAEAKAKAQAEEEARLAAEKEAKARAKAEKEARLAIEREAKAKIKAEEEARMAAEKEAQATAVENSFVAEKTDSNRNFGIGIVSGICGQSDCYGLELDYICHKSNNGFKTYTMVNVGRDVYNVDCGDYIDFTSYTATAGAGYGIPITNFLEITPFITAGGLFMPDEIKEFINDTLLSYIVEPGARIALTYKSLSIFASAGVHWNFEASEIFSSLTYSYYYPADGFFFKVGAKWTF